MIEWIYESDAVETFCWAEIDRTDIMIVRTDDMRWAWRLESSKDRLTPRGECATLEKAKANALAALTRWQNRRDIVRELEVSLQALKEENTMLRDEQCLADAKVAEMHDTAMLRERAAVVAWLRERAETGNPMWLTLRRGMANCIERGEHRREEEP